MEDKVIGSRVSLTLAQKLRNLYQVYALANRGWGEILLTPVQN